MSCVDGYLYRFLLTYCKLIAAARVRPGTFGVSMAHSNIGNVSRTMSKWANGHHLRKACSLKDGETLVFAWIVFKSRADRDRVNANVMEMRG